MADYRPLVLSGTTAKSVITELPTSSILIADGVSLGASAFSVSGSVSATTVSSTSYRGNNFSSITVSAEAFAGGRFTGTNVSATVVNGLTFAGGAYTGTSVSATTVSSIAYTGKTYNASTSVTTPQVIAIAALSPGAASITARTVSALSVSADTRVITPVASATVFSGLEINGMPYPAPFAYVECSSAGTNTTDEINFASGATTTTVISDTNHIAWNDAEKYFTVSAAGTYEIIGNFAFDSGGQTDPIEITSKKNGSDVHILSPNQYGATGPNENSFHSILTAVAGDYITVTLHMDDGGVKTGHLEIGSNLTLKRIK